MTKTQKGWCILFEGKAPYIGWWFTRAEAIAGHVEYAQTTWQNCLELGDRCVKCTITYEVPKK